MSTTGKLSCHLCTIPFLVFSRSLTFLCLHPCHLRSGPCLFCLPTSWRYLAEQKLLRSCQQSRRRKFLGILSWVVVEVILPLSTTAACVCQGLDVEKGMFVMFLLCAVPSPLYALAPPVSGLSVLLLLGFFLFFISLSVYGSSPPPHILIFFVWHLVWSCCFSFSPSLPVSLWCPHGWLNDWSHKAVPPTRVRGAELSCAAPLILSPSERECRVWLRC